MPTDTSTQKIGRKEMPRLRSYALNSFVGWDTSRGQGEPAYLNQPNPRYQSYLKMADSARGPAEIFSFVEVNPISLFSPFYGVNMYQNFYHMPAGHHAGSSALGDMDGSDSMDGSDGAGNTGGSGSTAAREAASLGIPWGYRGISA